MGTIMGSSDGLAVSVGGRLVGDLSRSDIDKRDTRFRYERDAAQQDAVSLLMPVQGDDYPWPDGVHPVFDMNLPEGHLRHSLTTLFSKAIQGFDDFDLLRIVGPYQLGRLGVGERPDEGMPGIDVADLLAHDGAEGLLDDLLSRYARYSGISGVQPKVLVRDEGSVDRFTHKSATHIVKAWDQAFPQLAANEYFCMKAAQYAGIPVPKVSLSEQGNLLVVERFDVTVDSYLGFEDLCVLNGWGSRAKYDGSYEGCARQLKALVAPQMLAQALEQLFMTVALSAGVRNGDAHLKNFGLLYEHAGNDARVWIAPAFDLITTTAYRATDIMALLLAGSKAWPKYERLQAFGRTHCGLSERRLKEAVERVVEGIATARPELLEYAKAHPAFETIAQKMVAAWDAGVARSLTAA